MAFKSTTLSNQRGFSLIEVLITAAIAGALIFVFAALFEAVSKQQNQANIIGTVESFRSTVLRSINDGNAWKNTVNDAANNAAVACLKTNSACAHTADAQFPASYNMQVPADRTAALALTNQLRVLKDAADNVIIDNTVASRGINRNGGVCTTYPSNECPFKWEIRLAYRCPNSGASCVSPNVSVYAIPIFQPADGSKMPAVNASKYAVAMARGAGLNFTSDRIEAALRIAGATPLGGATGHCNPNGWKTIPLNTEVVAMPSGASLNTSTGVLTVPSGTYTCSATGTCFGCGAIKLKITLGGSVDVAVSPGNLAPAGTLAQAIIHQTPITISGTSGQLRLEQYCQTHASGNPSFGLGMPLPDYTSTTLASLNCIKLY